MNVGAIAQAVVAVATPLLTLLGVASRRHRLRSEIRENLTLVEELQKNEVLRDHTPAAGWLQGKIAVDVARLAGHSLGTPKKPIPKGSVAFAAIIGVALALVTYLTIRNGFTWYSVFPGIGAFLMVVSIFGMVTDRELPPDGDLPSGAVPVRSDTAQEQIAAAVTLASSGQQADRRFEPNGQAGVALWFLRRMGQGDYESGLALANQNWARCRIQSWLWNNRQQLGSDEKVLQNLADSLLERHEPAEVWSEFVDSEISSFMAAWGSIDPEKYGSASRRRRVARDYDLVVLAPVGDTGGYWVTTATSIPNALLFSMHRTGNSWLVASHLGAAPPTPGWPPTWWVTDDPAITSLPE